MPTADLELRSLLKAICPPGIAYHAVPLAIDVPSLPEEECTGIARMSESRRREFAAGRACARHALGQLGVQGAIIPVGVDRAPVWPQGFTGSISHTRSSAVAVAAPLERFSLLGVDIEEADPLDDALIGRVCRPEELAALARFPQPAYVAKRLFGAKESVFKCLWPRLRLFLEFEDVQIVFDSASAAFDVIGHGPIAGLGVTGSLKVRGAWDAGAQHLIALAWAI